MSIPVANGQALRLGRVRHWATPSFGDLRSQRVGRLFMAIVVCGMAVLFAREMLVTWSVPDADLLDPFNDANTYRAAGERLNAGHQLYALEPGDRPVLLVAGYPVPLLSPPPVAAIWRPLAALPFGFAVWVAAAWIALLGTIVYLVMRIGLPAAVVAAGLAFPIGEQLVAANLTAFMPGALVLVWVFRQHPRAGAIIGIMAGLKLAPAVMAAWFVGPHGAVGLAWVLAGGVLMAAVSVIGAGVTANVDYASIVGTIPPSEMSLSGQTGIGWLSTATSGAGMLASALVWRQPRLSFVIGVATLVLASPALHLTTLTLLLGALAPLIPEPAEVTVRPTRVVVGE